MKLRCLQILKDTNRVMKRYKIKIKNPVMGVPITFLDKYCPAQFEIVKFRKGDDDKDLSVNGKCPYFRILIRKKKAEPIVEA